MVMVMSLMMGGALGGETAELKLPRGKLKAIFGLSREISIFKGKSDAEIAGFAKGTGANAVFIHEDKPLAKACRDAGLFVYAEITLFGGAEVWEKHPEARPITAEGLPIEKDKWYGGLCPNQEWLRREKLEQIRRLVKEFGADGVWLDFVRYACHWEEKKPRIEQNCFCPVCLELFSKETGIGLPAEAKDAKARAQWILANHRERWAAFKCSRISGFVEECRKALKESDPGAVLGLFGVPWLKADYDDAIREIIGQDYAELGKSVDVFSPMCYHGMCGREAAWIASSSKEISRISGKPCAPIVQVAEIAPDDFAAALRAAVEPPLAGVIVFNMKQLKDPGKLEKFKAFRPEEQAPGR